MRLAVWLWAAFVLAIAAGLRITYTLLFAARIPYSPHFFAPRVPHEPSEEEALLRGESLSDSHAYEKIATNLLDHGTYTWQEKPPYRPSAYVPPGYPLFIARVYAIFGRNPWNVSGVQIALSLLMVGLVFFWGERRWGLKVALPASLLLALDPNSIAFSAILMGETLGAAIFLGAMLLFLENFGKPSWLRILISGVLLGLAALVRAATLYFVFLAIIPLLLHRAAKFKYRLALSALLLGGFVVPVGTWMVRNQIVTSSFHFAGVAGYNMLYTNAGSLVAWREHTNLTEARERIAERYRSELEPLADDPVALSRKDSQIARRIIRADPFGYALLHAAGGAAMLVATRSEDVAGLILGIEQRSADSPFRLLFSRGPSAAWAEFQKRGGLAFLSLAEIMLLLACYVFFFIGICRWRWRADWLAVFLLVAYTAAIVGPVADSRFRLGFMPLLYIFAARGLFNRKGLTSA